MQKLVDEMEIIMSFEMKIYDKFHAYEMMKVIEIKLMKTINVCDCRNKCCDFQTLKCDTQNARPTKQKEVCSPRLRSIWSQRTNKSPANIWKLKNLLQVKVHHLYFVETNGLFFNISKKKEIFLLKFVSEWLWIKTIISKVIRKYIFQ